MSLDRDAILSVLPSQRDGVERCFGLRGLVDAEPEFEGKLDRPADVVSSAGSAPHPRRFLERDLVAL